MKIKNICSGFSLIEVLIFISILSLFFVVAAAVTTASLRNMKINEHKILATRYAEELLEWLRSQKEIDWNDFVNTYSNKTYCFNISPISDWSIIEAECSDIQLINLLYKRNLRLANTVGTQVNVSIIVSWNEPGGTYTFPIKTVFSIWE